MLTHKISKSLGDSGADSYFMSDCTGNVNY